MLGDLFFIKKSRITNRVAKQLQVQTGKSFEQCVEIVKQCPWAKRKYNWWQLLWLSEKKVLREAIQNVKKCTCH